MNRLSYVQPAQLVPSLCEDAENMRKHGDESAQQSCSYDDICTASLHANAMRTEGTLVGWQGQSVIKIEGILVGWQGQSCCRAAR